MNVINVLLACNDSDGNLTNAIRGIEIVQSGNFVIRLDGTWLDFAEGDTWIRVDGRLCTARRLQTWVGNCVWNLYRFAFDDAVWLLEHARKEHWSTVEGAPFLYDSYNDGDRLAEPLRLTLAGDETPRRTSKQERAALAAWNSGEPRRV